MNALVQCPEPIWDTSNPLGGPRRLLRRFPGHLAQRRAGLPATKGLGMVLGDRGRVSNLRNCP